MLTASTSINSPKYISNGRGAWSGTIEEAFKLDSSMWDTLAGCFEFAGIEEDEDFSLDESLQALAAKMSDFEIASHLFDDPNVEIGD